MYRRIGGVLIAALLILASASAGVAAAPTASASNGSTGTVVATDAAEENDTAETAYVTEDGDVVLVYEEASDNPKSTGKLGMDMSTGLVHLLFEEPIEGEEEVTGQATFELTPDAVSGDGNFVVSKPDAIESLSVDVTGEQTDQNAAVDATFSAEVASGGSLYSSMETQGSVTITGDRFTSSGSYSQTLDSSSSSSQSVDTHRRISISETANGYTVTDDRREVITDWTKERWDSRENATATLEQQFKATAEQFGGSATVTVNSYSFEEAPEDGRYILNIDYRVELTGVKDGINTQLTGYLAQNRDLDLTQAEAQEIATRVQKVQIDDISFSTATSDGTTTTEWSVNIGNYDEAALAMLDAAETVQTEDIEITEEQIDRARKTIEAQQAADLTQKVTWQGQLSTSSGTQQVTGEIHYSTQNWGAYVSELESRGIENGEVTFEFHAQSSGDEIETQLSISVTKEDLLKDATSQLMNSADADQETKDFLQAFRNSEFEKAKMQLRFEGDKAVIEAGASFQNLSAMRAAFDESYPGGDSDQFMLAGLVHEDTGEVAKTYVRVENVGDGSPTESDVRNLEGVGDDTEIKMPGEWDRDFPTMDSADARDFLGVETPTPTPTETPEAPDTPGDDDDAADDGSSGLTPGFGFGAAVVAALAGAVLLARRD